MRKILVFTFTSLLLLYNIVQASTIEEKRMIAEHSFSSPNAKWEVLDQPYIKKYVLFKLVDSDHTHRPVIAVGEQDKGLLLTYGVVHVSPNPLIGAFNDIVRDEGINVTADNVEEYARFFASVYGIPTWIARDSLSYMKKQLKWIEDQGDMEKVALLKERIRWKSEEQQQELQVHITPIGRKFHVEYVYLAKEPQNEFKVTNSFFIHNDGTVVSQEQAKWQSLSEKQE